MSRDTEWYYELVVKFEYKKFEKQSIYIETAEQQTAEIRPSDTII